MTQQSCEKIAPPPRPQDYTALAKAARFFGAPHERFSDRLNQASEDELFVYDEFRRRSLKPRDQIEASLKPARLTAFGRVLRTALQDKVMIDLGCGSPTLSRLPTLIAQHLGARAYVGVDRLIEDYGRSAGTEEGPLTKTYVSQDILSYLATQPTSDGTCFYLAGIEPQDSRHPETNAYIAASLTEMQRIAVPGDSIVIGLGTHGFDPTNYGFDLKYTATGLNRYNEEVTAHQIFTSGEITNVAG